MNPSASYALSSAQPSIMSDGNLLFKGKYTLDFGTEAVAEGKIQPVVASASASAEPTEPSEDALVSDAASPSASASASATAAGPVSQVTVQECDFRGRYHADSKMWELSVAYGATLQGGATGGTATQGTASAAASGSASAPSSAASSAGASAEASATSAAS